LDGRLEGFAAELAAQPPDRYRGSFACQRATVRLPGDEPFVFGVAFAFRLGPESGVQVESLRIDGDFGELRAAGSVENLKDPTLLLRISADLHIADVERIF